MSFGLIHPAAIWYVHCFERIRTNAGFYNRGVYVRNKPEETFHRGNIQPASQRDIQRLPEGSRADGALSIFTDADLRTSESPNQVADRIRYEGAVYEVSTIERWPSHNRAVLTKVGQ